MTLIPLLYGIQTFILTIFSSIRIPYRLPVLSTGNQLQRLPSSTNVECRRWSGIENRSHSIFPTGQSGLRTTRASDQTKRSTLKRCTEVRICISITFGSRGGTIQGIGPLCNCRMKYESNLLKLCNKCGETTLYFSYDEPL